jgi:predicted RNase H-like nuclease (RuvC/YqgF family)
VSYNVLEEWRIRDIEQKAGRATSRLHEIDSLRGDVGRLEHTNRELSSCIDGLRATVESCIERTERVERQLADAMMAEREKHPAPDGGKEG